MPKRKLGAKKKSVGRAPARIENPSWLREVPTGAAPEPPVQSRTDILPFNRLRWEDFERLCVRLTYGVATKEGQGAQ
jgi:hypothetical protein